MWTGALKVLYNPGFVARLSGAKERTEEQTFIEETYFTMELLESSTDEELGQILRTTLNNLISVFESVEDSDEAVKFLMAYIARQIGRGEIPKMQGESLLKDLVFIYKNCRVNELRTLILKYLTLVRWFFECRYRNLKNFEDFMNRLSVSGEWICPMEILIDFAFYI